MVLVVLLQYVGLCVRVTNTILCHFTEASSILNEQTEDKSNINTFWTTFSKKYFSISIMYEVMSKIACYYTWKPVRKGLTYCLKVKYKVLHCPHPLMAQSAPTYWLSPSAIATGPMNWLFAEGALASLIKAMSLKKGPSDWWYSSC